jgi:hypothetical protein
MAIYIRRREFVAALGTTAAWPLVASAQDAAHLYRLGFLTPIGRESPAIAAFFDELHTGAMLSFRISAPPRPRKS